MTYLNDPAYLQKMVKKFKKNRIQAYIQTKKDPLDNLKRDIKSGLRDFKRPNSFSYEVLKWLKKNNISIAKNLSKWQRFLILIILYSKKIMKFSK